MVSYVDKRLGQYRYGLEQDRAHLVFRIGKNKTRSFTVVIASAYDARGLIGPEHNGIAILDEDNRSVVVDQIARISSGYFGPSESQRMVFRDIVAMSWTEFRSLCEGHPRSRVPYLA